MSYKTVAFFFMILFCFEAKPIIGGAVDKLNKGTADNIELAGKVAGATVATAGVTLVEAAGAAGNFFRSYN